MGTQSQESMPFAQVDDKWWFPPRCPMLLEMVLLGLFIALSQPAQGSEMFFLKNSRVHTWGQNSTGKRVLKTSLLSRLDLYFAFAGSKNQR